MCISKESMLYVCRAGSVSAAVAVSQIPAETLLALRCFTKLERERKSSSECSGGHSIAPSKQSQHDPIAPLQPSQELFQPALSQSNPAANVFLGCQSTLPQSSLVNPMISRRTQGSERSQQLALSDLARGEVMASLLTHEDRIPLPQQQSWHFQCQLLHAYFTQVCVFFLVPLGDSRHKIACI